VDAARELMNQLLLGGVVGEVGEVVE
jgi:hypothetical protein